MTELVNFLQSPDGITKLFLFFIPGFISQLIGDMIGPVPTDDRGKRIIDAIGYSALNFGALSTVLTTLDQLGLRSGEPAIKDAFLFVFPVFYPFMILQARERQWFGFSTPYPNTWDQFFARRNRNYYVKARLKGEKDEYVLGRYGSSSITSQSPAAEMLLLEAVYDTDLNGVWYIRPNTISFLLPLSECQTIEFIEEGYYKDVRRQLEQKFGPFRAPATTATGTSEGDVATQT